MKRTFSGLGLRASFSRPTQWEVKCNLGGPAPAEETCRQDSGQGALLALTIRRQPAAIRASQAHG